MIAALADLWRVFKGAGISLDEAEARALGAPSGETISVWCAVANRHGNMIAHVMCVTLTLVQWRHCADQLAGVPMAPQNYVRAAICLLLALPFVAVIWIIRLAYIRVAVVTPEQTQEASDGTTFQRTTGSPAGE